MQDLEKNNWIILGPPGIIHEIYANPIVMTSKFHVCYNYFRYLWYYLDILGEKTLLTLSAPSTLK